MGTASANSRHEVPAADALGRGRFRRKLPYIYSSDQIRQLMAAAASLPPTGTIRPLTYAMLFGLGVRVAKPMRAANKPTVSAQQSYYQQQQ